MPDNSNSKIKYQPREGDILFQDLDCGDLCTAIKEVTIGIDSALFSHIGLVQKVDDKWVVLEAISDGVKYTALLDFFKRSQDKEENPKIWVARVKKEYVNVLERINVSDFMGLPYDEAFLMNNGKYYCSELLYEIFKKANNNHAFFNLEPMTFKNPKTLQYSPVWVDYYRNLGIKIPEGELGINPAGISRSEKIEIVYRLGKVSKR